MLIYCRYAGSMQHAFQGFPQENYISGDRFEDLSGSRSQRFTSTPVIFS